MNKKITLKQLAAISNFSVSTISKALSDNHEISKETKKKIKELAKFYNYTPNVMAQSLKSKKTKTIGVIIPNILSHFFAKVLAGIECEVTKKGYNMITCISNESYKKEAKSIQMLAAGSVDGFIVSLSKETQVKNNYKHIIEVIKNGLPVVMFDRTSDEVKCDKVVINDFESAYNATKHLLDASCKKILFVSPISTTNVGFERAKGYSEAIKNHELKVSVPKFINYTSHTHLKNELEYYLDNDTPDGILAADELSAIFSMNHAISKGYKIPEEISIIGFTDGILSENSNPPLTTINQHGTKLGEIAVSTLIKRIVSKKEKDYFTQVIPTEMIYRKSSKSLVKV